MSFLCIGYLDLLKSRSSEYILFFLLDSRWARNFEDLTIFGSHLRLLFLNTLHRMKVLVSWFGPFTTDTNIIEDLHRIRL